jgi:16S rRNA (adenine1518-N6/adenine1519-N6)-dimethyltransferase
LADAKLAPKKSWGQNFLHDQTVLAEAAALVGAKPGVSVIELGAGLGALTFHLLRAGATVYAVERDREIVPVLKTALGEAEGLHVIEADIQGLDWADWQRRLGQPLLVAGNLPYQISSRMVVSLADASTHLGVAVLMLQREVALRLVAAPDTSDYGLLSVLAQRSLTPVIARVVPAGAFLPRPKVDSALVRLVPHGKTRTPELDLALVQVARAAFGQRRKTLHNSLAAGLGQSKDQVALLLGAAGIVPSRRAETLDLGEFERIAAAFLARGEVGSPSQD